MPRQYNHFRKTSAPEGLAAFIVMCVWLERISKMGGGTDGRTDCRSRCEIVVLSVLCEPWKIFCKVAKVYSQLSPKLPYPYHLEQCDRSLKARGVICILSAKYPEFLQVEGHRRFGNICYVANNSSDTNYLFFLLFFSLPFESINPKQAYPTSTRFMLKHGIFVISLRFYLCVSSSVRLITCC